MVGGKASTMKKTMGIETSQSPSFFMYAGVVLFLFRFIFFDAFSRGFGEEGVDAVESFAVG